MTNAIDVLVQVRSPKHVEQLMYSCFSRGSCLKAYGTVATSEWSGYGGVSSPVDLTMLQVLLDIIKGTM